MKRGDILFNPQAGRKYILNRRVGRGGFGEAWKADPIKGRRKDEPVCVKINRKSGPWHRECYFGEILRGHSGAVRMLDEFVVVQDGKPVYCSASTLALGSVYDHRPGWSPEYMLKQIKRVVEAAASLHRMGAVHRDITPLNVLRTLDEKLVLADFGIALHGVGKPVKADYFNAWRAPDSVFRERAYWAPRDDVWQLGQLMAFLFGADEAAPIRPSDVAALNCPDNAKALIYRAVAPRQHRLESAGRLLEIWEAAGLPFSRPVALDGKNVVFTGRGSKPRRQLERMARKAGATPQRRVNGKTDIVVVGDSAPLWAAGSEGGKKILAGLEQLDRGSTIKFVRESSLFDQTRSRR